MDVPLRKYWGDMSPCPIGIDASDQGAGQVMSKLLVNTSTWNGKMSISLRAE